VVIISGALNRQRTTVMSKIEKREAEVSDEADWSRAWQVVAQLAEARATTLREIGAPGPAAPTSHLLSDAATATTLEVGDQLPRDIAEIERAARALRRAEPTLEPSRPAIETSGEVRGGRSLWLLLGLIWLTALLVVSCGAVALALLVL